MLTQPSIDRAQELSDEEHTEKLKLFDDLLPKLEAYITSQAHKKSYSLPSEFLEMEDFKEIGRIQTWAAVISWDPEKGSLEGWAKRRIWTNMNVVVTRQYQSKRIPHGLDDTGNKQRPISLSSLDIRGIELVESISDDSATDPLEYLLEEELYQVVKEKLLVMGERIAAAILRFTLFPDRELMLLCSADKNNDSKRKIKVTNRALATRMGISVTRISVAKSVLYNSIKECSHD